MGICQSIDGLDAQERYVSANMGNVGGGHSYTNSQIRSKLREQYYGNNEKSDRYVTTRDWNRINTHVAPARSHYDYCGNFKY